MQNGNAYEDGLSAFWEPLKAYWASGSNADRDALRAAAAPDAIHWQYTHGVASKQLSTCADSMRATIRLRHSPERAEANEAAAMGYLATSIEYGRRAVAGNPQNVQALFRSLGRLRKGFESSLSGR